MARYITQSIFDTAAVVAAEYLAFDPASFMDIIYKIAKSKNEDYQDENLVQELTTAATGINRLLQKKTKQTELHTQFRQILFCIKNYNTDGSKKGLSRFGGTLFHKESNPIRDIGGKSVTNVESYLSLFSKGGNSHDARWLETMNQ